MSTLILTCDTGEGHNSCAKAIKEVYDAEGISCEIINPVRFVAEWFAKFVHITHTHMYQDFPGVFRSGYKFTQKHNKLTTAKGSFPYWVLSLGAEKLHTYILRHQVDRIICVHPLLMMMVSEQQRRYHLNCPVAYVSTDYTCCPGVQDGKPDICFIPDAALAAEFCCDHIDAAQLSFSGIPIRQQFYNHTEKAAARAQFGLSPDLPNLLMMCGSMGCGPMEEMLAALAADGSFQISVVCGNNEALFQKLRETYADFPHVHILGYVREVSALMDSADLFVTKPGGLSSTEAAAKCLPAVYVNAVGGCENYNQDFFTSRNCGVAAESTSDVIARCRELLRDPERLAQMRAALEKLHFPNSSKIIFEEMNNTKIPFERVRSH